jgi:hypothetical protein
MIVVDTQKDPSVLAITEISVRYTLWYAPSRHR